MKGLGIAGACLIGSLAAAGCNDEGVCQHYVSVVKYLNGASCDPSSPFNSATIGQQCDAALKSCSAQDQYWLDQYLGYFDGPYYHLPRDHPYQCSWQSEGLASALGEEEFGLFRRELEKTQGYELVNLSAACQQSGLGAALLSLTSGGTFGRMGCHAWGGDYTVAPPWSPTEPINPSGSETITQDGLELTWENFGSPTVMDGGCTLHLELVSPTTNTVNLYQETCGAYVLGSAWLSSFGLPCFVDVQAEGNITANTGGTYYWSYALQQ